MRASASTRCANIWRSRRRRRRFIREGERRYRSLIDNVADYAIFMTDAQGRITTWNGGAEAMLGYTADEAIGQPIDLFSTTEDVAAGMLPKQMELARHTGRATERELESAQGCPTPLHRKRVGHGARRKRAAAGLRAFPAGRDREAPHRRPNANSCSTPSAPRAAKPNAPAARKTSSWRHSATSCARR